MENTAMVGACKQNGLNRGGYEYFSKSENRRTV
jgi:hypothetical protein